MGLINQNYQDKRLNKKVKPAIQGGGYNYLGKEKTVTVPKRWLSDPDHVVAELAYITPREQKILLDANLYGSLKGKPNKGPGGLPSLQGDMGSVGGGSSGGGGGGGGQDYSSVPASVPSTKPSAPPGGGATSLGSGRDYSPDSSSVSNNDGRLDYLTGDYLDIDITEEQKETLAEQRQQARYSISPMEDPKNKAIALGLGMVIPGAGSLFGAYKNSTAMGYSIDNPFSGFFTGGTGSTPPAIGGGGDGRSQMNALAPLAPFVVSNTAPIKSEASQWYNNIGTNTTNNFNFATAYANAKLNLTKNLSTHGPLAQLAVNDSPYYDWLKVNKINKGIL